MNKTIGWILAIAAVLLLALPIIWMISGMWGYGGMMGSYGMMGRGFGFYSPLGWLGMVLMWLVPIGIVTLLVVGAVALIKNLTNSPGNSSQINTPASGRTCQNCGRSAQVDWGTCPYCGQKLS